MSRVGTQHEAEVIRIEAGDTQGAGRYDRWAHRRGEPRQLIVWWSIYLFFASMLSLGGMGYIGLVGYEVFRPATIILLSMTGIGLSILWPMVRLSQVPPTDPSGSFALDGFVVLVPALVVLAAQSMPWMAGWPATVSLTIGASYFSWSAAIAALLAIYYMRLTSWIPRWLWMLHILVLVSAGPVIAAMASPLGASPKMIETLLMLSPLTAPFEAAADRTWLGVSARVESHHIAAAFAPLVLVFVAVGKKR